MNYGKCAILESCIRISFPEVIQIRINIIGFAKLFLKEFALQYPIENLY